MTEQKFSPRVDLEYLDGSVAGVEAEKEEIILAARTPEREAREWDWLICLSWGLGMPWFWRTRDEETGKARRQWVREAERNRPVIQNLIEPRIDTLVGVEAYHPRFIGRNTAQIGTEDNEKVRAVGDAANHAAGVVKLGSRKLDLDHLKHMVGLSWARIGWDQTAGQMASGWEQVPCPTCKGTCEDPMQPGVPCVTCAAEGMVAAAMGRESTPGQVFMPRAMRPEGDVCLTVHPPWEVLADPSSVDPKRPQRLIHEYLMTPAEAWSFWFGEDTGITQSMLHTGGLGRVCAMLHSGWLTQSFTDTGNMVLVREVLCAPCERWPRGLHAVEVGGVWAIGGALPEHGRIPYVPWRGYSVIGRAYPRSTCERILHLQYAHHQLLWDILDHVEFTTHVRVIKPKNVSFTVEDQPGVVSFHGNNPGAKPDWFRDPGVPQDSWNQLDRLERAADEASYATPLLRGQTQSDSSARHDAWLEQRQLQPMKRMLQDNEESLKLIGELLVDTLKTNYEPGRQLRDVFGSGGQMRFAAFDADKMGSSANVELIPERDLGRTLSARREELTAMKTAGVFDDPRLMRLFEIASPDQPFSEDQSDDAVALFEQRTVREWDLESNPAEMVMDPMTGAEQLSWTPMPPPMPFENFAAHLACHKAFYNELKMALGHDHPKTKAVEAHIIQTEEFQAGAEMRMQGMAAQAASAYGMANAQDPNAQPQDAVQTAESMGAAPVEQPSPPETQQSLQQVDAALQE